MIVSVRGLVPFAFFAIFKMFFTLRDLIYNPNHIVVGDFRQVAERLGPAVSIGLRHCKKLTGRAVSETSGLQLLRDIGLLTTMSVQLN